MPRRRPKKTVFKMRGVLLVRDLIIRVPPPIFFAGAHWYLQIAIADAPLTHN